MANLAERISKIRDYYCKGNNAEFAKMLDMSAQQTSNYCGGTRNAGAKVIERILATFPEVRRVWLTEGDGDMFKPEYASQVNNGSIEGDMVQTNNISNNDLSEYARLRQENETLKEQVARLIAITEGLTRVIASSSSEKIIRESMDVLRENK